MLFTLYFVTMETNNTSTTQQPQKKVSKFWEACLKSQGTIIINDPTILLQ